MMRKLCLILLAACLASMAGWAQELKQADVGTMRTPPSLPQQLEATGVLEATQWTQQAVPGKSGRAMAGKVRLKASIADSLTLAEIDESVTGTKQASAIVTTKAYGTNQAYVYNLWGLRDTLTATYDQRAGTISINPGLVYNHPTYGPVWICPYDAKANTYSTKNPIKGTLNADGSITLAGWGVFVTEGDYKGGSFARFKGSELEVPNAVMTDTLYDINNPSSRTTVLSYPVYIDSVSVNQVSILNFSGIGAVVNAVLNPDKTVTIAPQRVLTNSMYGDFYCYSHDWNGAPLNKSSITATSTATSWTLGSWGIFSRNVLSLMARGYWNSTISFASGLVTYPEKKKLDWSGSGTEADPYVIKTLDQYLAFAESVNLGQSYQGKHIALGADIDMSSLAEAYRPVGNESHPFEGTFDGKGYTLKNWSHTAYDESYQGLFGMAGVQSVIKNLKVDNPSLTSAGAYTGIVVGYSSGVVSNVTVTGATMKHNNSFGGGVIGAFKGTTASNLSFTGTLTGAGETGGVIGELQAGTVTDLESHGTVSVESVYSSVFHGLGGVIGGTLNKGEMHIERCYNDAMVNATASNVLTGGVVGDLAYANLSGSFNVGPVAAVCTTSRELDGTINQVGAAGGVAGRVYGSTMTDCYNSNIVINSGNNEHVGGLLGYVVKPIMTYVNGHFEGYKNPSRVTSCYNSGEVITPTMRSTQGFYGSTYADSVLVNCYFDQQVTGNVMPDPSASCIMRTAQLTSGTLPQGFDSKVWTATAGLYPALSHFASRAESHLSVSPLVFAGSETSRKVKSTFTVSSVNNIVWRIFANSSYVTSSTGLTMSGDSVKINNVNSSETMVARIEGNDKLVKMVMLETVDPTAFRGSGTQDDPYLISDKDDLKKLNEGVTVNAQTYLGDYFKQTNDIDLENATDFVGVGTDGKSAHNFAGTYDGQGYTIHRLYIDSVGLNGFGKATPSKSRQYAGFFGYIGPKGVVKNLNIASDCHFYAYGYVGAIAGYNKGTIENCRNYADVTAAYTNAGGITGYQDTGSKVINCYNSGTVTVGSNRAAGIVPYSKGTTAGCQNDGLVRCTYLPDYPDDGPYNAGGIVGSTSSAAVITDNINTGTVTAYSNTAGIVTSASTGSLIARNINYGSVINGNPDDYGTGAFTARDLTTVTSGYNFENNYYDKQLGYYGAAYRAPFKGINGLLTRQLTNGEALEGIDAQQVDFAAGQYPVLKRFKDEPAAVAHRNMVVTLPDDENIDDVRHTAALSDTASWSLVKAQQFAIEGGNRLTVAIAGDTALRDTLTASLGGYTKVIPLRAQPIAFAGSGTKADPYQIRSKADMLLLASYTNDDDYAFTGRYFKVMNDIDFDTTAYVPVAVKLHKLDADFDGNGKKFVNINYTSDYRLSTGRYFALIGNVGENGRVHNVNLASGYMAAYGSTGGIAGRVYGTVDSCESHITVSTTKDDGFGGIAGRVMGGGKVTNCKGYAKFDAKYDNVGGIVYDVLRGGLVENCENYSDINAPYSSVAGIAAQNAGTISNCVNHGAIAGKGSVAGIVGTSLGGDVLLNCRNEGTVTATGSEAGGILASTTNRSDSIIIAGCSNTAAVTANKYAGGLVGYAYVKMLVDSCYNKGDVSTVAKYAAGLLSYAYKGSRFTHCYNTGTVIGGGDYAGGLIGDVNGEDFVVSDCVNYGDVMGSGMYGAGISSSYEGVMERVVNYGHVESDSYAAGITGYASDAKYVNCVNYGDVAMTGTTRDYASAGGLMALNRASSMTNCYNLGKVTSTAYASGLIGDARDDTSYGPFNVRNCYTAGEISGPDSSYVSHVTASTDDEVLLDSVYYDITVNRTVPYSNIDSTGIALSTREMVHAALGDAYVEREGMYPVLAELADSVLSNWYAATVVLPEGFGPDSVAGPFIVGNPEGTTWTASPEIVTIDGNVATPTATGEVTLTKTCGTHTRSYRLVVTMTTGVTDVDASDAAIVAREYFNLNGQSLGTKRPESAGIYIERDRYSNGAGRARKIVVK